MPTKTTSKKKALEGNPGKRDLTISAPNYTSLLKADPPEYLDQIAKDEFKRIVPELIKLRILKIGDLHNISIYCQAVSNMIQANDHIQQNGFMLTNPLNGIIYKNPMAGIFNDSQRQILKYSQEFGLTPMSRTKIDIPDVENDDGMFS